MLFRIIPEERAKENILSFIRVHYHDKFENLKNFVKININKKLFLQIKHGNQQAEERLFGLIKKQKKNLDKNKINKIKRLWEINEEKILENIQKITGIKISTKKIICYLDEYTKLGFYSYNSITISTEIKLEDTLLVISHELFHIFYFKKIRALSLKLNPEKEWKLAEVVIYLLQNEESMKKFWPNSKIYLYPEIKDIYQRVKIFWTFGNFKEFIIKSYNLIR